MEPSIKTKTKPRPGNVHRIPIGTGYAYAVVARVAPGKVLVYCYLSAQPLTDSELAQLAPEQRDAIKMVAELPFTQAGRWPLVAAVSGFRPEVWPVPAFWHCHSILGYLLRSYDERLRFIAERPADEDEALLQPEDGLAGGELWQQKLSALAARRFGGGDAAAASI